MVTPPQTVFEGFYFDGRTAGRRPVTISVTPSGLLIHQQDGSTLWWLYEQLRHSEGYDSRDPVRLEKGDGIAEAIVVAHDGLLEAIRQIAPGASSRFRTPARGAVRLLRIVIAAVASVLLAAFLYLWGIPALTDAAASHVPVQWEERLGRSVMQHLAPEERQCNDPQRTQALDEILGTLLAPQPESPYSFTVTVVDDDDANAFAVPGGQIVVFHGLLMKAESAEELAGVLAHEIEHIRQRHSLKAVFRGLSLRALLGMVTSGGAGIGTAMETAGAVGTLRYQRGDEEAADREGMQLILEARIDPAGIVRLMRRLDENGGSRSRGLEYLSSHPLTEARVEQLEQMANQARYSPAPLLPNYSWDDIRKVCDSRH
jgi:predicted Zn-dependent protease